MEVSLTPLVYVRQPEYWGIEVIGCLRGGIVLAPTAPYIVILPLNGTIGTQGIEVIGATRSEKISIPPNKCCQIGIELIRGQGRGCFFLK
jgi:hypothetical protein